MPTINGLVSTSSSRLRGIQPWPTFTFGSDSRTCLGVRNHAWQSQPSPHTTVTARSTRTRTTQTGIVFLGNAFELLGIGEEV
jgi:hypothetical protein